MVGLAPCDLGLDPALAQLAATARIVVRAVGGDAAGSPARPTDPTAHRRHPVDERDQLRAVVAVAPRQPPGKREPARIDEEMMLGAISGSINRARARLGAPFFACT